MGFLGSIGDAFKSAVSGLSKIADVVAPICSFIPGLNPVVTAIAAGIKAVDGLTDKPPNLGKMFEGVMGMLPGGTLGKVLGPLSQAGGGSAGDIAKMIAGAAAGDEKGATGGLLGDVLKSVLGNGAVGGEDSPLGSLASGLFGDLAGKLQGSGFQNDLADLLTKLTGTKPGDTLTADQVTEALTRLTGKSVERNIDGEVQQVPERSIAPEFLKLFERRIQSTIADNQRSQSSFTDYSRPPLQLQ